MARIRAGRDSSTEPSAPADTGESDDTDESAGEADTVASDRTKQRATEPAFDSEGVEPGDAEESEAGRVRYAWRALWVVGLSSVVIALNQSTLNVALPSVVRHFDAGPLASSWVLLGFMLANTVFLVMFGRMSDMFGRRRLYLIGVAAFTVSSLLLGLAPDIGILIALRIVHGASAALLLANSGAIIGNAFPKRLLSRGMGLFMASFSVAQLVGPSVGGILADGLGWQWVFWINVPIGVLCFVLGSLVLRKVPSKSPREGLDLTGNVLFLVALSCLVIGISGVSAFGWGHPVVLGGIAVFVVLLAAFVLVERRSRSPVVDLQLFGDWSMSTAMISAFVNTLARWVPLLLVALYFQSVHADSAFVAGLKVMPMPIGMVIGSSALGLLTRHFGARAMATIGSVLVGAGLATLLANVSADPDYAMVATGLLLIGLGSGIFVSANTTAIMEMSPPDRLGIANAIRLMIQNVAMVLSTALTLTIVASHLPPNLREQVFGGTISGISQESLDGLLTGHREALILLFGISVVGVLTCVASQRTAGRGRRRGHPVQPEPDSPSGR